MDFFSGQTAKERGLGQSWLMLLLAMNVNATSKARHFPVRAVSAKLSVLTRFLRRNARRGNNVCN